MEFAERIDHLPPYLFAEIDKKIAAKKAEGVDVISLGIGDPVEPTPPHIIEALCEAVRDPVNHRYPSYYGMPEFRREIAAWYKRRFEVDLDPDTEVLPLIGSKEGLAHIFLALLNAGDKALIPDPGYPVYQTGAILAGGSARYMPLTGDRDFQPDLDGLFDSDFAKTKFMLLNYPSNPTAAVAAEGLFDKAVAVATERDIVIANDLAYSEITFDGYKAPSILQTPGAKNNAIEFHSLSKTYNMTGWRCGWVVGNAQVIDALGSVKTNIDSGIFNAVQLAGIRALTGPQDCVAEMVEVYRRRRDVVVETLAAIGLKAEKPKATVFVWVPVPEGYTSASFAAFMLDKAGVVVPPGNSYGPSGEGYIRISLTVTDDRLEEALDRIRRNL
jgi:LL-diaminopimelate aminotransferase